MLSNFKEILKSSGASLCDPISFGKYKDRHLWEIPETYWQTFCTKEGESYNKILSKIAEAKEEKHKLESKPPRRKVDPAKIKEFLYAHQKEYVIRFGDMPYSNLWAAIGTGKTYAYLELVRQKIRVGDKILILCPKTVFTSWNDAIQSYLGAKATYINITGSSKEKLQRLSYDRYFYITNYETLLNEEILSKLIQKRFSFIAADEAHKYFCNTKAKTFKHAFALSANIENKNILTGTPRRSKNENLYGLITFLDRGERFGSSFYKFREQYFYKGYNGFEYNFREEKRKEFWAKIKSCSYVVTQDVLQLPELTEQVLEIELTGEALKHYKDMKKDAMIEINKYNANPVVAPIAIAKITKLRQICSGFVRNTQEEVVHDFNKDKIEALKDFLDGIDEPVIITCSYVPEIEDIQKTLQSKNYTFGVIHGNIKDKDKNIYIDEFSKGKLDVLIIQEDSGGVGINGLQNKCSLMLRYSYGYSYDTDKQVIGRIQRSGQTKNMRMVRFKTILPGGKQTIEDAIIQTIQNKAEGFSNLVKHFKG
jgi:superfamily II DNA or RNA helicase